MAANNPRLIKTSKKDPFTDHYQIGEKLGHGGTSTVWHVTHKKSLRDYAVKLHYKERVRIPREKNYRMIANEVESMAKVSGSQYIVNFEDVYENDERVYIVQELLRGPNVYSFCSRNQNSLQRPLAKSCDASKEKFAAKIVRDILCGLDACHVHGICHGDIKPTNVIWHDKRVAKLIDFDCSDTCHHSIKGLANGRGTREFMAPEFFTDRTHGTAVDIWATGLLSCQLLYGLFANGNSPEYKPVIDFAPDRRTIESINDELYTDMLPSMGVSQNAIEAIVAMMQVQPDQRPSAHDLLQYQWLKKDC
jgi:calcium-dependent protein kinase